MIREHVRRESRVYMDGLHIYQGLVALGYRHATVDHADHFVAPCGVHIQGTESHWAHTKPVLRARHRKLTPQYLPNPLMAADFNRNAIEPEFIDLVLQRLVSHTL